MKLTAWIATACLLATLGYFQLPTVIQHRFTLHMLLHLFITGMVAPMAAIIMNRRRIYPLHDRCALAVLWMSLADFVVIWGWHTPALHAAMVQSSFLFTLEQTSYLMVGIGLWLSVLGDLNDRTHLAAGIAGLLFTSMHMSLLGVLLAVADRPFYVHTYTEQALQDQQSGGILMLAVGGLIYLAAALRILARLLDLNVSAASKTDAAGLDTDVF